MKKNLTELVFILDKSGSMAGMEKDVIGGFNSMIEKQKSQEGEVLVSTVLFSNASRVIHDRKSIEEIAPLTENDYVAFGSTALLDAIGGAIKHIANIHKYAREEDVPERTMFIITTDGKENCSREFSSNKVKNMILRQEEKYGWEFLFLASNIDAVETAECMGIRSDRAVNYDVKAESAKMFTCMSETISAYRQEKAIPKGWGRRFEKELKKSDENN